MNLRAGIITYHGANNHGAVLQAYALCRILNESGLDAHVINYNPDYLVKPYLKLGRRPNVVLMNFIRHQRFDCFRKRYIPITQRVYRTAAELQAKPPAADVFICGSDQVWNLKMHGGGLDESFFLGFAPANSRRVAYAPSFGDTEIPDTVCERVADLLGKFDFLSVREAEGQALIRQLTGRPASRVLDPTLLIKDYSPVMQLPTKAPKHFIATYQLERTKLFDAFLLSIQQILQMPIVNIGSQHMEHADYNYNFLGPSRWLGWLKQASFICTNSFHGTAFSIILRKPFVTFPHQQSPKLNGRLRSLLDGLQLSSRFPQAVTVADRCSEFLQPIDYVSVESRLATQAKASRQFLKNAVLGETLWS